MVLVPALHAATSVLVADDDDRVRAALAGLLDDEPGFSVVGQAADGRQALALAEQHAPALVLVDVRMPGGGPELVRALRALQPSVVVVGLSANADTATWTQLVAAGAGGYLLKGAVADDLPSLLRRCVRGELLVAVPGAADVLRRLLTRPG